MSRILAFTLLAASLWAQERIVSTRVFTEIPGVLFTVDGTVYTGGATLLWPEHSRHIITVSPVHDISDGVRAACESWSGNIDTKLDGLTIAVTANRAITYYRANCSLAYRVVLQFNPGGYPFQCTAGPQYGKVYANGTCFDRDAELWVGAGGALVLQAYPPSGYVFTGWHDGVSPSSAFETTVVVNRPMTLSPKFAPAVRVALETSPPGLQVLADRTPVYTPATLDWAPESRHALGPVSPQSDLYGKLWVFDSWTHGGTEHQVYTVQGTANIPQTVTATYKPGVRVSFVTPEGLRLSVDGRDNWPSYNFVWKSGSVHNVAAPAEYVDARGRRRVFSGWGHGGAAAQEIEATGSDMRFILDYELLGKLTVRSNAGQSLMVNGSECGLPCTIEPRQGTSLSLAPPASVMANDAARWDFQSWSDGAPRERTWTASADEQTLTALYRASYRVAASAEPAWGATFRFEPASPDGFYADGSEVKLTADVKPGYRFRSWEGDLIGKWNSGIMKATGPRLARALLDKVPYVPPAAVRNAAGETAEPGVAPGSLVAIYGVNLAASVEAAEGSPLPQALADVVVRLGDRLLPLVLASPEQITAQLPSDLEPGDHELAVRSGDASEITTTFTAVRNAPGLFTRLVDGEPLAVAAHADGTLIGPESPAQPGETVTLLGTGLGRYKGVVLDGFAAPSSPRLALADAVEIVAGERVLRAAAAFAAPGQVGITAIRFQVPEDTAGNLELKVRVNGCESNAVALSVK